MNFTRSKRGFGILEPSLSSHILFMYHHHIVDAYSLMFLYSLSSHMFFDGSPLYCLKFRMTIMDHHVLLKFTHNFYSSIIVLLKINIILL